MMRPQQGQVSSSTAFPVEKMSLRAVFLVHPMSSSSAMGPMNPNPLSYGVCAMSGLLVTCLVEALSASRRFRPNELAASAGSGRRAGISSP